MNKAIATVISTSLFSCLAIAPVGAEVATLQLDYDSPQDSGKIQAQGVQAVLDYDKNIDESDNIEYVPTLTISVGNQVFQTIGESSFSKYSLVQIAEMDQSNPFPEVIFSSFTGGAHCCTAVKIITSNVEGSAWQVVDAGMFDGGMREVSDPDQDGIYEYITADNRFLYLYSSYAGSYPPMQIWQLEGLELRDVSHDGRFTFLHREAIQGMWQAIQAASQEDHEINGVLAGYVATKAILGEAQSAWQLMLKRYDRTSDWGVEWCDGQLNDQGECEGRWITSTYPEALQVFLTEAGYLSGDETLPQK